MNTSFAFHSSVPSDHYCEPTPLRLPVRAIVSPAHTRPRYPDTVFPPPGYDYGLENLCMWKPPKRVDGDAIDYSDMPTPKRDMTPDEFAHLSHLIIERIKANAGKDKDIDYLRAYLEEHYTNIPEDITDEWTVVLTQCCNE